MPLLARRRTPGQQQALARRASAAVVQQGRTQQRAMTASAMQVSLTDKTAVGKVAALRDNWQYVAWTYRRGLGELRYAAAYLGNSSMRMRYFPAAYAAGEQTPIPAEDAGVPQDLVDMAHALMARLASGGPLAMAALQKKLTENFEIAGECFLVGEIDALTQIESWNIRSVSEMQFTRDGKVGVRDSPGSNNDVRWLDPASFVSRLWWPDPEWSMKADSPVRAVLDVCEELLLLGRDVRATARSRIANNGVLLLPDSMSVAQMSNSNTSDVEDDPFLSALAEAMTTAMTDEGSAAAVSPLLLRGPEAALAAVRHVTFDRQVHAGNIEARQELISRLATGLDLPSEVLTGKADLNHWTAWQVDDDAFRHHIEPMVIVQVDALTVGYLWPMLDACNSWTPEQVRQVLIWYDPTELVTHPDRTQDALQLWDRIALSDEALRRITGFSENDKPGSQEILFRMATHVRSIDPAVQQAILKRLDPTLDIVPVGPAPPAVDKDLPPDAPAPAVQGPPPAADAPAPAPPAAAAAVITPPSVLRQRALAARVRLALESAADPVPVVIEGVVAAGRAAGSLDGVADAAKAASRRLTDIDRDLRTRLVAACNTAVKRTLEKAGAKVLTKARTASGAQIRRSVEGLPVWRVPGRLGLALCASMGVQEQTLLDEQLADLRVQWDRWVATGQDQALRQAAKIAGVDATSAYTVLAGKFKDDRDAGWSALVDSLRGRVTALLTDDPVQSANAADEVAVVLVGSAPVRSALAIAGGFLSRQGTAGISGDAPVDPAEAPVFGGVATGPTISAFLSTSGQEVAAYQWVYGGSDRPFPPHEDLDGTVFGSFDDDSLTVQGDFPAGGFYTPGDHDGCLCDVTPVWIPVDDSDAPSDSDDDSAGSAGS
jgi:hypothetical protein